MARIISAVLASKSPAATLPEPSWARSRGPATGWSSHAEAGDWGDSGGVISSPARCTVAVSRRSRDEAPTRISNDPPSTTHRCNGTCQNEKARASSVKLTRALAPGSSDTWAKPLSS